MKEKSLYILKENKKIILIHPLFFFIIFFNSFLNIFDNNINMSIKKILYSINLYQIHLKKRKK